MAIDRIHFALLGSSPKFAATCPRPGPKLASEAMVAEKAVLKSSPVVNKRIVIIKNKQI